MQDGLEALDESLSGLNPGEWKERLTALADANGMSQDLGARHFATFIDQGNTLLVTFETMQGIQQLSDLAQPLGFDLVKNLGWSHLCVISDGDTWFRDGRVFGFFDQLIDDGFFEEFDRVVFYGAGPCGYAAAAFSVAAPGATVVAVQPQATLDPRMTEWDDRFTEMRRTSFTDRFGYAPDMLDAAEQAYIIYDPYEQLDAMHATLFARANVTRLRAHNLRGTVQTRLLEMGLLYRLLSLAGAGKLSALAFAKLFRARRDNGAYLRSLLKRLQDNDRPVLTALLCRNVSQRLRAPRFRKTLKRLEAQAANGEFTIPAAR
jgi:hypothetical protein